MRDDSIYEAARLIANAITPVDALPAIDESGGRVGSLTEAIIGLTAAFHGIRHSLGAIAESLDSIDTGIDDIKFDMRESDK